LGYIFVFVYIENSDCQVNINVSIILYQIHFSILHSTKTMIHESLSSHYILQIMLPILRSATRLPCIISYLFWSLSSLTLFWRTIARILFLFIWLLFKLSSLCTVPIADFENKRSEISCKLFGLPICYLWWLFQTLVVSTKLYLNCNINLPQSLYCIIEYHYLCWNVVYFLRQITSHA
jgi:hypothetical protein